MAALKSIFVVKMKCVSEKSCCAEVLGWCNKLHLWDLPNRKASFESAR